MTATTCQNCLQPVSNEWEHNKHTSAFRGSKWVCQKPYASSVTTSCPLTAAELRAWASPNPPIDVEHKIASAGDTRVYSRTATSTLIALWLADAIEVKEKAEAELKDMSVCMWVEDDDGNWDTSCGQTYTIIDGSPTKNLMRFCTFCGAKLSEILLSNINIGDEKESVK